MLSLTKIRLLLLEIFQIYIKVVLGDSLRVAVIEYIQLFII